MTAPVGLVRHPEPLALAQLPVGADVPGWATSGTLLSVTASAGQTSVLCNALGIPAKIPTVGPLTAFEVDQDLDPSLTGLIADLARPLATAGLSLLPVTTYDRGWVLVQQADATRAARLWQDAGFAIHDADRGADQ